MKKGETYEGIVERIAYPNKGIIRTEGIPVIVKNTVPGQKVTFQIQKKRSGKCEARLLEVVEKSKMELDEPTCKHFNVCGGCTYQNITYDDQLILKRDQVKELLDSVITDTYEFEGIKRSPKQFGYRNKMEFSFGDEIKDGPLALGMHKRGSFYDIVTVNECQIVDQDYRDILSCVRNFCVEKKLNFYHKMQHKGFLRHLVVRKGHKTGEILIALVTTTQKELELNELVHALLSLPLQGKIAGILHTLNDSLADVVQSDETKLLFGRDYFFEELLDLNFKITPFSFFQTNSLGAEVLYETVRDYIGTINEKVIFDLYSGTGTIAQILAPVAKKVVGVEIVKEAVEAAKANAKLNDLDNCEFIAGDVLKVIDDLTDKPDVIVLDPPRDGIHPKALDKIIQFGVDRIVYVSCKPTSLVRDLQVFHTNGYRVEKAVAVDMFPGTGHVEVVTLLTRSVATQ